MPEDLSVYPGYNIILPGHSYVNDTAGYDPTIDAGIYSGTSYSTPIVSAAAALLLGEYPDLDTRELKAALLLGADWQGPVPCTSVQYEMNDTADDCSYARQPSNPAAANGPDSLSILNNVGFGILDVGQSLQYAHPDGVHIASGRLDAGNTTSYRFEVASTTDPVKVILTWNYPVRLTAAPDDTIAVPADTLPPMPNLDLKVDCPGMDAIEADSSHQNNEFAVFMPSQAGTCMATVSAESGSGVEYALASTAGFDTLDQHPTFVSSGLNMTTGVLTITFSEAIDVTPATNVVPAKIHVRESGSYTGGITLSAGELDTTADGTTISFTLTASNRAAAAGLAVPELTIEPGAVQDTSGNLIVGSFDVSTAAFVDATPISLQDDKPTDVAFSNDGTKMFVVGDTGNNINEYNLTAAFDASTAAFAHFFSVSLQDANPTGMAFSNDGTKMFVIGLSSDKIHEYTLSSAFDVSTATVDSFLATSQDASPTDVAFSSNGTKMFVVGRSGNNIHEYNLTAAFDVSTGTFVDSFSVSSQDDKPTDVAFSNDGTKMFVTGSGEGNINEYNLSSAFDASTAAFAHFFNVSSREMTPTGMAFSNDGTKMFVVGDTGGAINEYTLRPVYPITITDAFITTWKTDSDGQTVTIPVHSGLTYNYTVIWGDGSQDFNMTGNAVHTYATAGDYEVRIYGVYPRIHLDGHADASKLHSIDQWGSNRWATMESAFEGASNMIYNATDAPDLSGVTDMSEMFRDAVKFNGNLSSWDVSSVTDMSDMFYNTAAFNQPLNNWNVSSVTDMSGMFYGGILNQPLNNWDVSSVTDMSGMFNSNSKFNGNLSSWDVSSVTDMSDMFNMAFKFNRDLSSWNVSSVTDMSDMFFLAFDFTQNLGNWYATLNSTSIDRADVPGVVGSISAQNSQLEGHNPTYGIGSGTDSARFEIVGGNQLNMKSVVAGRDSYEVRVTATVSSNVFGTGDHLRVFEITAPEFRDITVDFVTTWRTDTANQTVTIPVHSGLTYDYTVLWGDGDSSTGVTSNATHTYDTAGDYQVRIYGTYPGIHLDDHRDAPKLISIDQWGTNGWASMNSAFKGASSMVYNATDAPNLSGVTDMFGMFDDAVSFNGNLSSWDVSAVTNMSFMFSGAAAFNGDISDWDVSSVTGMSRMFSNATSFHQPLNNWNVSKVTDMRNMFHSPSPSSFDRPLNNWNVSSVTDMSAMFSGATSFDRPLNNWNVSSVTDMSAMFSGATSFDRPLNNWNVSSVTDMSAMFSGATSFDHPLNDWDVSKVTNMFNMFRGATSFNQNLGIWYVTLDGSSIAGTAVPGVVGSILTQNSQLKTHKPVYDIGDSSDKDRFGITDGTKLSMTSVITGKNSYTANITATGSNVFESGNNWRTLEITVTGRADSSVDFVTTWSTGSANQTVTIPVRSGLDYNYTVIWGDGSKNSTLAGTATHTYAEAGDYQVRIYGTYPGIHLNNHPDAPKLASIDQWGTNGWASMESAFNGASNMVYNATDAPNLSDVTSTSRMFQSARSFDGNISGWDVSGVTDMSEMFHRAVAFNGDISDWNVSEVTNMNRMFRFATVFNQTLNGWDVSKVINTRDMFDGAAAFNGDVSSWDVSKVTDMGYMFSGASAFNGDVSGWDVSAGPNMGYMFSRALNFNGNLSSWDVSEVTDMSHMFRGATAFNQDISSWDVSKVTNMNNMFQGATSFQQNLGEWYIALSYTPIDRATVPATVGPISAKNSPLGSHNPTYGIVSDADSRHFEITGNRLRMTSVATGQSSYTVNITASGNDVFESGNNWRVFEITAPEVRDPTVDFITTWRTGSANQAVTIPVHSDLTYNYAVLWGDGTNSTGLAGNAVHTYAGAGNYSVRIYGTYPGIHLNNHADASKLASIDRWGTNPWATMESAFRGASKMVYNATDVPDLSRVRDMSYMLSNATAFNQDISSWSVSRATDLSGMFRGATAFNQDISSWSVSRATDLSGMFRGATAFNQDISSWSVSRATDMSGMFRGATAFNQNISSWDVSKVTDLSGMFRGATAFNQNISSWDVSRATDLSGMFRGATAFNQNISSWDVSRATDLSGMFRGATAFNQNISSWDVSRATDMSGMFDGATLFQQNLGEWYVTFGNAYVDRTAVPGVIGSVSAKNSPLGNHNLTYGIGSGADSRYFGIVNGNQLNMTSAGAKYSYAVNVTASGNDVFENGNNWHVFEITVIGSEDPAVDFVTTWRIGYENQRLTIPVHSDLTYDYVVLWGDDTNSTGVTGNAVHTYAEAGNYSVRIYGTYPGIHLNNHADASWLRSIDQWGTNQWTTMESAFYGARDMVYNATDAPDLSGVTNMSNMFYAAIAFNGNLSSWDVSKVTDMSEMFHGANAFNGDLSSWDVSLVTDMNSMFYFTDAFNGDLSSWDVSSVTDMSYMFFAAKAFNGDLSGWDVSSVTNMSNMFFAAKAFNGDVSSWNVSGVTNMDYMFDEADLFQQNLGKWYATIDSTSIGREDVPGVVGLISAQNSHLEGHNSTYGIGSGADSARFEIVGGNQLNMTSVVAGRDSYEVSVTVTGDDVFEDGNNWRVFEITVIDSRDPAVDFVTTWRTGSANQAVTIPVHSGMIYNYTVLWGDGDSSTDVTGNAVHTYDAADDYQVRIYGTYPGIHLNNHADASKLVSIDQWGSSQWASMDSAFEGASNMIYNATDAPDLSGVTDMSEMFHDASFNGNISSWDVSKVTDMSEMFRNARAFNQPLNGWAVSAVTDMSYMFNGAQAFNQNISSWSVSKVTDMSHMFDLALAFNQNLFWDVSAVTDMSQMFFNARNFNGDISSWNVSKVTTMSGMFANTETFNGDISSWDVSAVTDMSDMFNSAAVFDQDISSWNVSKVTTMFQMFRGAAVFDQDISSWNVSAVTDMSDMFVGANAFDQNLGKWYVTLNSTSINKTAVPGVVGSISAQNPYLNENYFFSYGIGSGADSARFGIVGDNQLNMTSVGTKSSYMVNVTTTGIFFGLPQHHMVEITVTDYRDPAADFVTTWQTTSSDLAVTIPVHSGPTYDYTVLWGDGANSTGVTGNATHTYDAAGDYQVRIYGTYPGISLNNHDDASKLRSIDRWGSSQWASMESAFEGASNMIYNATDAPDLSGVTDMSEMFWGAYDFNGNLSSWDVSGVADMSYVFAFTEKFNGDISSWDVSKATNMTRMFASTSAFDGNLSSWNVSEVTDMSEMFTRTSAFDGDLSGWDVSGVTDMSEMFSFAKVFNGDISSWDVSGVTDMESMFYYAGAFNQDIPSWDASKVTDMSGMFYNAVAFDGNVSGWTVSSVTDMSQMFYDADAFDGNLSSWDVSSVTDMSQMFYDAGDFDGDVSSWDVSKVTDMSQMFHTADDFNQSLSSWNVSSVTLMNDMFNGADAFDGDVSSWDVSSVTLMSSMFEGASAFDGDVSSWNVSRVTNMASMFNKVADFDGNLSGWDVSRVTDMSGMFSGTDTFDGDVSSWNVSKVTNMASMFEGAASFNRDVSSWDVSGVTDMDYMFDDADAFNQNLGKWYATLNSTSIVRADVPGVVGSVSAQNSPLKGHNPTYGIGAGADSARFEIVGGNQLNMTSVVADRDSYEVRVTVTGDDVFEDGNNWRVFEITAPKVRDITADFVTTWQTTSSDLAVTIPVHSGPTYDYTVLWGDGANSTGVTGNATHTYDAAGDYQVRIYGTYPGISLNNHDDASKLRSIDRWGSSQWASMESAFEGASNMIYNATDAPDLSGVTDMSEMFWGAYDFNGNLSSWDVSGVADMSYVFAFTEKFNGDISSWDVSKATNMTRMFASTSAFDGNLSSWNVSEVTDMSEMFTRTSAFDGDLSGWDVSGVTDMSEMFSFAKVFNGDISSWDVSGVTDMESMFYYAGAFNQDIPSWDASKVTDMSGMFYNAVAFDGNVSGWTVSSVTDMSQMFYDADAFDGNVSGWTVSSVTDMSQMFYDADAFDGNLSSWDVSSVTDMSQMFHTADDFNQSLSSWNVSSVTLMNDMFNGADAFDGDVSSWDVSSVTLMSSMFEGASAFDGDVSSWNVSRVTNMASMFNKVADFDGNLSGWDVSRVTDMSGMFSGTDTFDGDVSSWNVSKVTNMASMFEGAASFNRDVSSWDVSGVTDMDYMFDDADAFNQNLGKWYATLNSTSIVRADVPGVVGSVSAQNSPLKGHNPTYGIGAGADSARFEIVGGNQLNMTSVVADRDSYEVRVTVTGDDVFEDGNNWRVFEITAPKVRDITADFVTTWQTTTANESVTIPGTGTYTVDWGDDSTPTAASGGVTHTYTDAGTYTVSISGGLTQISLGFGGVTNSEKLQSIEQWGNMTWGSMKSAFEGASNMTYNATDAPDLSGVTDMSSMFVEASLFDGDLSAWNVSTVTKMESMFSKAAAFDGNVSTWDVSKVTDMSYMFASSAFDGDVSTWDVSSVTNMERMFNAAGSFNRPLNGWNVSSVTNMADMFLGASDFNRPLNGWNVLSVTSMNGMFEEAAAFDGDVSTWNVSKVTDMSGMFAYSPFNQPISTWNVSKVTDMSSMFEGATKFNQPISTWNVSSVMDMKDMFIDAEKFNQNLGRWYVVPDSTTFTQGAASLDVTTISAQNKFLRDQTPIYKIGTGGNSALFNMTGDTLAFKASPGAGSYEANVTASGADVFENSTSWRVLDIEVTGSANQPPTVTISGASSITEDTSGTLTGTATDDDGTVSSYSWSVDDTSTITITSGNAATLQYTASQVASDTEVTFTLTVTDDDGATGSDTHDVTVTNVVANQPPTVTISGASSITEDTSGTLTGTATDDDGTVSSYSWSVDDTSTITITTGNAATLQYTASQVASDTEVTFTLTVTDDDGATGSDTHDVTVTNVVANQPPTVTISGASSITEDTSGTLTGTATDDDGTVSSYSWSVDDTSTITITSGNSATLQYTASQVASDTEVTFTLTVTDDDGATGSDTHDVTVTNVVANQPPTVTISGASSITEDTSGTLTGTATDDDGTVSSYSWSVDDTSTITITSGNAATLQYTASQVASDTEVTFTLTVTDDDGATGSDTHDVTVTNVVANQPPTVTISGASSITEDTSGTLTGTATDDDGTVSSYSWSVDDTSTITITTGNAATLQYTASQVASDTEVTFTLTVTDDDGATGSDTHDVTVTNVVANQPPTVTISGASSITEDTSGTLTGTATDDDGTVSSYSWSVDDTSTITITSGNSATLQYTASQVASDTEVTFTLTVTDDDGATGSDTHDVTVTNVVANQPPTVTISGASSITEDTSGTLTGTATDDDGTVSSYSWSVDDTSTITITSGNAATLQYTASQVTSDTEVTFTLTVTDDDGATGSDTHDVTVTNVVANQPPTVTISGASSITEDTSGTLTGTATDDDGTVSSYSWSVDDTSTITITSGNAATLQYTASQVTSDTEVTFTLTVTDDDGATGSDTHDVTVTNVVANQPPTVTISGASSITENTSGTLTSTASDSDGTISSYSWSVDDTSTITITSGNSATLEYDALEVTSNTEVTFTLTVTDDDGATGSDTYDVTVTNVVQGNLSPVLNAIPPQSGDELTRITFTATADDPDGDPLSFSLQGTIPAGASITRGGSFSWTPSTDQAGITHNIIVAVSDGRGGTDTVTVAVTVNDVAPLPVSARSSGSSITLTMSEAVTSSGTGPNGFSVVSGGDSVSVDSIAGSGTKSLVLGLSGSVSAPATLSYSGNGDVEDSNGTPLGQFSGLTISLQSKSKSAAQPPAITIGSQGHPQAAVPKSDGPLAPVPADGTPYPLTIGKNGYPLNSQASTVVPTQVAAGQPVTMSVTVHNPTPIAYFAIYLNLQGSEISHLQSDAQIIWNYGQVYVIDRSGLMRDVTVTLSEDPDDPAQKTFTVTVTLSEGMGQTNMAIRTWNAAGQLATVQIFDAIDVRAQEPEPVVVDPEPAEPEPVVVDPEPAAVDDPAERDVLAIRMWSGFEPESISDAQLLASLGLDYPGADIPSWVMTELGVLAAGGEVTVDEFKTALEYVLENA